MESKRQEGCRLDQLYCLDIKQAVEYFGIGEKKLRQIIVDNLDTGIFIQNGTKYLIKRKRFESWLDRITSI